jgi:hypothetical protein
MKFAGPIAVPENGNLTNPQYVHLAVPYGARSQRSLWLLNFFAHAAESGTLVRKNILIRATERERERQDNAKSRFAAQVNVLILELILCSTHSPHSPESMPNPQTTTFSQLSELIKQWQFWADFGIILVRFPADFWIIMGNLFCQFDFGDEFVLVCG